MTGEATLSNEKNYIYRKLYVTHLDFDTKEKHDLVYCRYFLNINSILFSNYHRKAPYGAFQNQQIHFSAVLAISSSTSSAISLFSALTEI